MRISRLATLLAIPLLAPGAVAQQKLDRAKRPTAGPAPTFSFPKFATRTLSNGLTVAIVENHELPVVAVRAVIEGGGLVDPRGKEGVYSLLSAMLREGTTSMSADELAEA